jgi:hypothetical protein
MKTDVIVQKGGRPLKCDRTAVQTTAFQPSKTPNISQGKRTTTALHRPTLHCTVQYKKNPNCTRPGRNTIYRPIVLPMSPNAVRGLRKKWDVGAVSL